MHCIRGAFLGATMPEVVLVTPERHVAEVSRLFPWAKICAESRKGIYSAMNDGARLSSGKYLYFLGKDDVVLPALSRATASLNREHPFALFGDVYWGSQGTFRGDPSRIRVLARNVCHQGIIYSRQAFIRHGPYLRRMRVQADHLLNIKILWDRHDGSRVRHFDEPLAWYSGDGFSMVHRDPVFWRLYPTVMRRFVGGWAACTLALYRKLRGV
jgi:glycosyltransferase involved in cell wall biosynthesis